MPSDLDEFRQLLDQFGEAAETVSFAQLYPLSDLTGAQLVEFSEVWDVLPGEQRRRLVHALVELAEASFQVNFDAILRHCLHDPDEKVRARAIEGLWENEEVGLVGPLITMLRADPSTQVRGAAAAGLGRYVLAGELERLEPPVQARIMTELLTTFHLAAESVEVRRRAVESAAYACTPEIVEALDMAYYDENERMRISAIVGMGRSCDRRWAETILAEMENTLAAMRYEAALASGELGLRQAVPALSRLMDDADSQVREATIHALGQIGGTEAKEVLLAAYDDADENVRAGLDEALAEVALAEGELDLMLYEVGDGPAGDLYDDDYLAIWHADEEEADEPDLDAWSPDDI